MAQLGSPISGGLRAASTTVPSSVFFGGDSGDNQETVNLLRQNQNSLTTISAGILGIQQRVGVLGNSLAQISSQLTQESFLEQSRIRQEQEQERRLAEQQIREGKESLVERKIQGALLSPVRAIAQRTKGVLERLKDFFVTLLAGWLTNQLFETVKAYSEGNKSKLEEIKNNVVKTLGVVGGIFLLLNGGFLAIIGRVGTLSATILEAVTGAIFKKPFQALAAAVSKIIPKPVQQAAKSAAAGLSGFLGKTGRVLRGAAPAIAGGVLSAMDIAGGEDPGRAIAGAAGGMTSSTLAFGLGSLIPFPGTGVTAGFFAYSPGEQFAKGLYDTMMGKKPEEKKTTPKTQAKQSKTPTADNLQISSREEQDFSKPPEAGRIEIKGDTKEEAKPAETSAQPQEQTYSYASVFYDEATTGAMIQPLPTQSLQAKMERVAPLPEPEPTVVITSSPSAQSATPASYGASASTNVPAIPSSNPENFYILYSQMQYNVVT